MAVSPGHSLTSRKCEPFPCYSLRSYCQRLFCKYRIASNLVGWTSIVRTVGARQLTCRRNARNSNALDERRVRPVFENPNHWQRSHPSVAKMFETQWWPLSFQPKSIRWRWCECCRISIHRSCTASALLCVECTHRWWMNAIERRMDRVRPLSNRQSNHCPGYISLPDRDRMQSNCDRGYANCHRTVDWPIALMLREYCPRYRCQPDCSIGFDCPISATNNINNSTTGILERIVTNIIDESFVDRSENSVTPSLQIIDSHIKIIFTSSQILPINVILSWRNVAIGRLRRHFRIDTVGNDLPEIAERFHNWNVFR